MSNQLELIDLTILATVTGGAQNDRIDLPPPGGGCFPPIRGNGYLTSGGGTELPKPTLPGGS